MRVDARLWLTDCVNWRALAVTVRYANRTREGVHRMNHEVAFSDALVAEFVDCLRESAQTNRAAHRVPTPAFIRVVQGNVGSRAVHDFASHRTLSYLSWRAEGDLKTGGATGPLPPPALIY
jgi:hypothetical protein